MELIRLNTIAVNENLYFLKRWLSQPKRLGTFLPISKKLSCTAVKLIHHPQDQLIIELGSGTGRLTQSILDSGFSNVILVELDPDLCDFLKVRFANRTQIKQIVQGDAKNLTSLLPGFIQKASTIISVIPFMYLKKEERMDIIAEGFKMLSINGRFLHVCYSPYMPLDERYASKLLAKKWINMPSGFVWELYDRGYKNAISA